MAPLASALASTCLALAAGARTEYEASVRIEARARSGGEAATLAVEMDPGASLSARERRLTAAAAYTPHLTLGGEALDDLALLHRAQVSFGWSGGGRPGLRAVADGSYGTVDFLAERPPGAGQPAEGGATRVETIPTVTRLAVLSAAISLVADAELTPRQRVQLTLGVFASGGATAEAQRSLPSQRGARGALSHAWRALPRDALEAELADTVTDFQEGDLTNTASATLTWRHEIAPSGQAWAGAGLAMTSTAPPQGSWGTRLFPTAVVGLRQPLEGRSLVGAIVLSVAPITDRVTGATYQRYDATASLLLRAGRRWSLSAATSGGLGVSGGELVEEIAIAEVGATWASPRGLDAGLGVRGIWQHQTGAAPGTEARSLREIGFFLSLGARSRGPL